MWFSNSQTSVSHHSTPWWHPKNSSPILVESPCLWASHFLNSSRCSWQTWRKLQPKSCDITLFINISLHLGCVLWYLFFCCKVEMPTEPAFYQSVVCISYPTVAMSSSWSSINPADWGESESMTKRKIQRSLSGNSRTWKWSYSVVPQKSIWIPYFLGRFAPWMNSNSISTYINHFSFIEFRPKKQPLKPPPWHDPLRRAASLCGGAGLCLAEHRSRRVRLGGCKLCLGRKIGVEGGNPYGNPWKSMKIYGDVTWWCMQQRLDFGSFPNLLDKSKW